MSCCGSCASGLPCEGEPSPLGVGGPSVGFDADGDGYYTGSPLGDTPPAGLWSSGWVTKGADGKPNGRRKVAHRDERGRPRQSHRPGRPDRSDAADSLSSLAWTVVPVALTGLAVAGAVRILGW